MVTKMSRILVEEATLRKYIDGYFKYIALIENNVANWFGYYDALDMYKNEEYDIDNDDYSIIEDYSKLVNKEIQWLKSIQYTEDNKW